MKTSKTMRNIGLVLLLSMFAGSGAQKIWKLGKTQTKTFIEVYGMSPSVAQMIVLAAGVFELGAVIMIMHGEYSSNAQNSKLGILGLSLFTILATLLFKVYPKFKLIQFFSNMAILGGLVLFYDCLSN